MKALGSAFWNFAPLTNEGTLDRFWGFPKEPDQATVRVMEDVVMGRTQYNGGFYSEQGRALCIPDVAETLSTGKQDTATLSTAPTLRLQEKRASRLRELGDTRAQRKRLDLSI